METVWFSELLNTIERLRAQVKVAREYLQDIAIEPNGTGFVFQEHAKEALDMFLGEDAALAETDGGWK